MTTLFTLGAPIGLWMQAIQIAQQTRFHDVPVVKEWSPANSDWLFPPPPPPPPSPIAMTVVVVDWV
jgi:hypothetical protein